MSKLVKETPMPPAAPDGPEVDAFVGTAITLTGKDGARVPLAMSVLVARNHPEAPDNHDLAMGLAMGIGYLAVESGARTEDEVAKFIGEATASIMMGASIALNVEGK